MVLVVAELALVVLELPHGSVEYQTIFAVGLTLFAITLLMNVVSGIVLRRFREVYE